MERIPSGYRYLPTPTPDCKLYGRPFYLGLLPDWFGLLHACKQTYNEAAPLPTQLNTFIAHEQAGAELLFECLSRLRSPITTLRLKIDMDLKQWQASPYPDLRRKVPSLKIVEVITPAAPSWAVNDLYPFSSLSSIDHQKLMWEMKLKSERDMIRHWLTNGGNSSLDIVFLAH